MPAIPISNFATRYNGPLNGELKEIVLVQTTGTATAGDTVDISSIASNVVEVRCFGATNGTGGGATSFAAPDVVLDTGGALSGEAVTIILKVLSADEA